MRGIYLAAYKAEHPEHDIVYQDINGLRDLAGDMLDVDLSDYDYIIATPPCNYWSRANYRRDVSTYALNTKHLLPDILNKLESLGKPFIVENVRNSSLMSKFGIFNRNCKVIFYGRHTYFTNIDLDLTGVVQLAENINYISPNKRQGSDNVHNVIERFIDTVELNY